MLPSPFMQYDDCNPATCPNGKCNAIGECIETVAREMRRLGSHFEKTAYDCVIDAPIPHVKSPPLVPNATTIAAIEELKHGGGTRCVGCDGYSCDNGCAYPGAARTIVAPEPPARQRLIDADSATRKTFPMARGLLDYFPDALAAVAQVSYIGNEKHNPGEPMHHARGKSMDHADCILRHLVGRGGFDGDVRESAALAWRALALLQEELEAENGFPLPRGARPV